MKKIFYIFPVILLFITESLQGQDFSAEEFLLVRQQNQAITAVQLENNYPRPSAFYLKDFSKEINFKEILFLDTVNDKLDLTADELELLKQNLFVVTERLSFNNFGQAFHAVYNDDLPVFVSTDAILYALHMSYDKILKILERQIMAGNLEAYLQALYDNFGILIQKYKSVPALENGLADADLYVTLAYSLATDKLQPGHFAGAETIRAVWEAIRSEKMTEMPLFTFPNRLRKLDFSQFTVRGHYVYTEQEKWMGLKSLEPYFRTMMWLGRTDFLLTPPPANPWEKPWDIIEIQRMHYGAFLLNELALLSGKKELLEWNEQVITYLVGESDNLTPAEYQDILQAQAITSAIQLTDTTTVKNLRKAFGSNPELGQKILSDFFLMDPWSEKPGELPVSYRLSGQRFIIDSYILGSVVFDRVIHNGMKVMRMMPKTLDALFALGNNDALPLLKDELVRYPYQGQLANLRWLTDAKPEDFWSESLYNVWLNSIRELNPGGDETKLPLFMQTAAWHQEKMNTQLASWSHLRHDNLLYAKQSYTGGTGCSFPYSYVEPYPAFYGRLKQFAADAGAFFSKLPAANSEIENIAAFFPKFKSVMARLEILANKELSGTPFSETESQWLQTMLFQQGGSGMPPYTGWYTDLFFDLWDAAKGDFTIVDVHTQPTDEGGNVVGKVLHTGVGMVNLGVFIADNPFIRGQLMTFTGPVMSYYETITTNFKRMTDQEWEKMVWNNTLPPRPDWTRIYLAGAKGERLAKGAELPSMLYTSGNILPLNESGITVYPNPVSDFLTVSFDIKKATRGTISLYNAGGILMRQLPENFFMSGANTKKVDFGGLPEGIYLLRLVTGDQESRSVKIIKR